MVMFIVQAFIYDDVLFIVLQWSEL